MKRSSQFRFILLLADFFIADKIFLIVQIVAEEALLADVTIRTEMTLDHFCAAEQIGGVIATDALRALVAQFALLASQAVAAVLVVAREGIRIVNILAPVCSTAVIAVLRGTCTHAEFAIFTVLIERRHLRNTLIEVMILLEERP